MEYGQKRGAAMDKQDASKVQSTDTGALGIFHLKRLWADALSGRRTSSPEEGSITRAVIDGLELGIIETIQFLNQERPAFAEFESWVLERHPGGVPPETRAKVNLAVTNLLEGRRQSYPRMLETTEPVFSEEDMRFWDEQGYVVLKQAIPRENCAVLESAMWERLGMRPDAPDGWQARNETFWISGMHHPIQAKNRSSVRIHRAFAQIWGTDELFHSGDRLSFNPPQAEECTSFGPSNLHWDASIALPMPFDVLGILYLNDVREDQGVFQCVPAFHHRMAAWLASLPDGADPRREILDAFEPSQIAGQAGDLIIWRQELPHGSSINRADYPRFAQYMAMYPPDRELNPVWR